MNKLTLLLFFIGFHTLNAQQFYTITYNYTDKNNYTCKSYLITNNKEAVFKIGDERPSGEITTNTGDIGFIINDKLSKFFYANESLSYCRFLHLTGQEIVYSDPYTEKTAWTILNDQRKKIGTYNCTQAKTTVNGRSYTVWFTFDVPIKFGPLKLHQLPGLIVEVAEDEGFLKMSLLSIYKNYEPTEFNPCKQYFMTPKKVINYKIYENTAVGIEKSLKTKALAIIKEQNDQNITTEYLDYVVIDGYLDIPKSLKSELKKLH